MLQMNVAFRILGWLMCGAVFELAHCLTGGPAVKERLLACLQKLCCVSGCHGWALCVLSPLPPSLLPPSLSSLSLPPSLLSCRPLWMWWWTSSFTTLRNSGRPFGIQHRHLVTETPPSPTGQITGRAAPRERETIIHVVKDKSVIKLIYYCLIIIVSKRVEEYFCKCSFVGVCVCKLVKNIHVFIMDCLKNRNL